MDYSGLWKMLIDRNMTKSDLAEATGLSSRVVSKLSKNGTVTTDTILRICEVLDCRVGDVMECVKENRVSFCTAYRRFGKTIGENECFRTVSFTYGGRDYLVYETKATATKATHIDCRADGTVYWEQYYPFGAMTGPTRTERVLIRPQIRKGTTGIVLIKGKPAVICGLDDGFFVSSRGTPKQADFVYVMSESAFKLFTPPVESI